MAWRILDPLEHPRQGAWAHQRLLAWDDATEPEYRLEVTDYGTQSQVQVLRRFGTSSWQPPPNWPISLTPFLLELMREIGVIPPVEPKAAFGLVEGRVSDSENLMFDLRDRVETAVTVGRVTGAYSQEDRWITAFDPAWEEHLYVDTVDGGRGGHRLQPEEQFFWSQALIDGYSQNDIQLTILAVLAGRRNVER